MSTNTEPDAQAVRVHVTRSRANPGGMDVHSILGAQVRPLRERKPPWFKVPPPGGERYRQLSSLIRSENLHTVCQEAACPNVGECWERGTATFRQANLERSAGARPRCPLDRAHGTAPRGRDLC